MVNISVIIFERMNDLKLLRTCIIGSQFTEEPVFQSLLPKRGPVFSSLPFPPSSICPESPARYSFCISLICSSISGSLHSSKMNIKYHGDL